jgi:hypothetical protein
MICADSKVQIEEEIRDKDRPINYYIYRGRVRYLMRLYFIIKNKELSRILFMFNQLTFLVKLLIKLIIYFDLKHLYNFFGTIIGMVISIDTLFNIQDPDKLIKKIKLFSKI